MTAITSPVRTSRRANKNALIVGFAIVGVVVWYFLLRFALGLSEGTASAAGAIALQQLANALSIGAIYALIALGYTMVYGIIELINFAHGDVFMVGAFLSLIFLAAIAGQSGEVTNLPLLILLLGPGLITFPAENDVYADQHAGVEIHRFLVADLAGLA